VIPVHNGTGDLGMTLKSLSLRLDGRDDVVVVENGSAPDLTDCTRRLVEQSDWPFSVRLVECARGLGNALRGGLAATTADLVVCTAADLPFGFSDLDALLSMSERPALAVGSKAMAADERPLKRRLASVAFRYLRDWLVPGLTADTQGTLLGSGPLMRALAARCQESGFLFSTELLALASRLHVRAVELPVSMTVSPSSTVRLLQNGTEMAYALYRLRRRLDETGFYPWVAMSREVGLAVTHPECGYDGSVDIRPATLVQA
jgi:glycosyltransferase involved in cell wall biosynthesis